MNPEQRIRQHFETSAATALKTQAAIGLQVADAARRIATVYDNGGKVLLCGNGGSASDALHFSAELLCRYEKERQPLAAIALPADTATLTAAGNDYDFSQVFARQITGLGKPNDVLIVFTTSGQSPNILEATRAATTAGLSVIALTGRDGGPLASLLDTSDLELRVPSDSTARTRKPTL
tara:strand:+ start:379 stop:915 length:537 start_codon:yes stop_codon:yes gene_type:complete